MHIWKINECANRYACTVESEMCKELSVGLSYNEEVSHELSHPFGGKVQRYGVQEWILPLTNKNDSSMHKNHCYWLIFKKRHYF